MAETAAILLHGPWPPPWQPDPSSRVSGNAEAATLGRLLFFDARLSPSGRVACSTCHRPERGWADGRARGQGLATSRRNTPSLLDVRLQRRLGWGGAGDSLWAQSIRPLLDAREMGSSAGHVKQHIARGADLAARYALIFGRPVDTVDDEAALVDAAKALAAYQETIVSGRTAFDAWRDALAAGDEAAAATYPAAARRGAALLVGAAGCSRCHAGPTFGDGGFHAVIARRSRDGGHAQDAKALGASPYNLNGRFNDSPRSGETIPYGAQARAGAFRTPTLRNVGRTAPYLHDGSAPTLVAAIRAHRGGPRLEKAQLADLVAFLGTLNAQ